MQRSKIDNYTYQYRVRRNQEVNAVKSQERTLKSLEDTESAIMNRMKNTKASIDKVNKQYIDALDSAYTSQDARISELKKKLEKHRSKYMHPNFKVEGSLNSDSKNINNGS
jgi:flagellar biosynthesis chaperone FliJ